MLEYLGLHEQEASRTTAASLLSALRFLEEAGEVAPADRLHATPAVTNAVREHAQAAAEAVSKSLLSTPAKRGQAPQMPTALVVAFEEVVCDRTRPLYQRAFATFRLLRHWASLRFDDTQGLSPASLEMRARGLFGCLERTKTSGPGKSNLVLPIFVSKAAWVKKEWLALGLELLTEGSFDFERDFLLPLPDSALKGAARGRALYSDSAAFSQKLLGTLSHWDGTAVLPKDAARFWTEHSDRAGLDSWAAALGVQKSERDFLGRWSPEGSTDSYVRTALRVVENIQLLAAHHARIVYMGGPDMFGEEHLLRQLSSFLQERGWSSADADEVAERLRLADYERRVPPMQQARGWSLTEPGANNHSVAVPEPSGSAAEGPEDTAPLQEALAQAESARAAPDVEPWGFVVSVTRGGRHRKLHHIGSCKQVPGVDYKTFEVFGDVMPGNHQLDSLCGRCFGTTSLPDEIEDAESFDSSSEAEAAPAAKKAKAVKVED